MSSSRPEDDTTLAKAIKKKRSHDPTDTFTLTDKEIEDLVMAMDYLNFFGILEQLVEDKKLRERDVFSAFNGDVDLMSRSNLLAPELTDYPLTVKLIERHERIFANLYPHLVNTPRATLI